MSAGGPTYGDAFVATFDPHGAHCWSQSFRDGADQLAGDVAFDAAGNMLVAGGLAPAGSATFWADWHLAQSIRK